MRFHGRSLSHKWNCLGKIILSRFINQPSHADNLPFVLLFDRTLLFTVHARTHPRFIQHYIAQDATWKL